ncbi:hypothetical protein DP116_14695 [Brasilonema bromeliae SPC951]|uniref:Uncharacterized protein n=1 Tax=Brasilonema bromeliae SPC951 TaxID=385972 RepID=A0ABX1P882_9CYAN|nr:hypothetical protein [Brasilonema bromeliae SPC951]
MFLTIKHLREKQNEYLEGSSKKRKFAGSLHSPVRVWNGSIAGDESSAQKSRPSEQDRRLIFVTIFKLHSHALLYPHLSVRFLVEPENLCSDSGNPPCSAQAGGMSKEC